MTISLTDPLFVSLLSLSLVFLATTLGSSFVFFFRKPMGPKIKSMVLGFAGGIMISASFFGLLLPSIEQSQSSEIYSNIAYLPPTIGFLLGAALLFGLDKIIPHFHKLQNVEEGPTNVKPLSQNLRFFLAVTMHNIPEGLAVGFACGLALSHQGEADAASLCFAAFSLALGIAIQNVPEGAAVSLPMYSDGMKKRNAFFFGTASGAVEPIFGVIALFLAKLSVVTPWLLAFAAGAMIYVTLDEILPEAREDRFSHHAMWSFMLGFALMMVLEVVLG